MNFQMIAKTELNGKWFLKYCEVFYTMDGIGRRKSHIQVFHVNTNLQPMNSDFPTFPNLSSMMIWFVMKPDNSWEMQSFLNAETKLGSDLSFCAHSYLNVTIVDERMQEETNCKGILLME